MRKVLLSVVAALLLLGGAASAQTNSTASVPAWTADQGTAIKAYSESQKNTPFVDPNLKLSLGMELPEHVELHLLPETMKIPSSDLYSYAIINDHAVIVDRTTHKVVHVW